MPNALKVACEVAGLERDTTTEIYVTSNHWAVAKTVECPVKSDTIRHEEFVGLESL